MKKIDLMTNKVWQHISDGLDRQQDDQRDEWERFMTALDRLPIPDRQQLQDGDDQQSRDDQPPLPQQPQQASADPLSWINLDQVDAEQPKTAAAKKRWSMFGRTSSSDIPLLVTAAKVNSPILKDRQTKKDSAKTKTDRKTRFSEETTKKKTKKDRKTDRQHLLDEDEEEETQNMTVREFTEHTLDD